jgi:hypothetical protein
MMFSSLDTFPSVVPKPRANFLRGSDHRILTQLASLVQANMVHESPSLGFLTCCTAFRATISMVALPPNVPTCCRKCGLSIATIIASVSCDTPALPSSAADTFSLPWLGGAQACSEIFGSRSLSLHLSPLVVLALPMFGQFLVSHVDWLRAGECSR